MVDEVSEGELIRMLIENTNKSKFTTRKEMRTVLKVEKGDFNASLDALVKSLNDLGLTLSAPSSLYESDVFFLTKDVDEANKKARTCEYSKRHYQLVVAMTLIHLENKAVELNKFLGMLKRVFGEKCSEDLFSELKRTKYVKVEKNEEEMVVMYGWRYYMDFSNFNPLEFFSA